MQAFRLAVSTACASFDASRVTRVLAIVATVLATAVVVLLASFVAVTTGLT